MIMIVIITLYVSNNVFLTFFFFFFSLFYVKQGSGIPGMDLSFKINPNVGPPMPEIPFLPPPPRTPREPFTYMESCVMKSV